jgi:hypothetical protein
MRNPVARAAAIALTTLLAVAAPAVAGGPVDPVGGETQLGTRSGLLYVSESLAVGSSGHFTPPYDAAYVSCGGHASVWQPTGGGLSVSGAAADNFVASMRPMDLDDAFESPPNSRPDDWWESTVRSVVGRTLTGFTVCTKSRTRYVRVAVPSSTSAERTASAACPTGWRVIGGGGFIATTDSFVNGSWPTSGTAWKVRVHDVVGGAGGMEVYAICRKKPDVKQVHRSVTGLAAGGSAVATTHCPGDRHVIGGGGRLSGSLGEAHLAGSFPIDGADSDSTPDDGWRVVGANDTGADKSLTVYALCVKAG